MNSETILITRNLTSGYGSNKVIEGLNIKIKKKKAIGIFGANGAGKSTLFKTLTGLLKPFSGEIIFKNENITGLKPHQILSKGLAHVQQGKHIFREMTVRENLEMGGYTIKDKNILKERMSKIMNMIPFLKKKSDNKGASLSGGEQQMCEIGRTLILPTTEMLLVDEPSLGLSPGRENWMFEKLRDLKNETGMTTVLIEQNIHRGLEEVDYAYILSNGKITREGTPDEITKEGKIAEEYLK